MSEKLPPVPGEDSFDEFLSAHLPEETSSEISRLVTPWTEAFLLILLSIGIGLINFPDRPLVGIIQGAASGALGLLGWFSGFCQAFVDIMKAGDVSMGVVCGGVKVALITPLYGILVYLVSVVISTIQSPRK